MLRFKKHHAFTLCFLKYVPMAFKKKTCINVGFLNRHAFTLRFQK